MKEIDQKIKEVREDVLNREPRIFKKKVKIIFDGKQYNLRIPREFVEKAGLDVNKEEFEFTLEIPEDKSELPALYGDLIEAG